MRSNLLWVRPTVYLLLVAGLMTVACETKRGEPAAKPPPTQPIRAAWMPAAAVEVGAGSDYSFGLALSPDGRRLVYPAAKAGLVSLWLEDLSMGGARALPSTDGAAVPFWSPDGTRIGFLANGHLRALDLGSGAVTDLAPAPAGRGAAWNRAGDLVFAPDAAEGLMRRAANGSLSTLTTVDRAAGESAHSWPAFLPDGRHVVFLVAATDQRRAGIWMAPLDEAAKRIYVGPSDAQPVVSGHTLLLLNAQSLMAQPLDPTTWRPAGRSALVGLQAGRGPLGQLFAAAAPDVLIYGPTASNARELRWVSRDGQARGRAGEPTEAWDLRISPDGGRVAVTELDPQLRTLDVWIREGTKPIPTRLSLGSGMDESAVWSPNGLRVAWVGAQRSILFRGAGAVLPEETGATLAPPVQLWDWSRDGARLLIGRMDPQTRDDLWVMSPDKDAKPTAYATGMFNQTYGAFSPDGRWIAYASDESGRPDIYIDSFPTPGGRVRVTTAGGTEPRWRRDGGELYFRRGSEVHVAALTAATGTLSIRSVDRLFDARAPIRAFDVTADGARFLLNLPLGGSAPQGATLIANWQPHSSPGHTDPKKQ